MARRPTVHRGGPSGLPVSIGQTPAEKSRATRARLSAIIASHPQQEKYIREAWQTIRRRPARVREAWFRMRESTVRAEAAMWQDALVRWMGEDVADMYQAEEWPAWTWYSDAN